MKRLPIPLLVTLLAVLTFVTWGVQSDDDPFADAPDDVSELSSTEQLLMEIMIGERQLLDWINEHGPEVARHDYILDRMIELRAMQAELQFELEAVDAAFNRAQEHAAAEISAVDDMENLRRQAAELALQQVAILEQELERANALAAEGVASLASVTEIATQLQAARIAGVEQQIALAELALRSASDNLDEQREALNQYLSRIHHAEQQLTRLSGLLEPSLAYSALEQKLDRQREALAEWELEGMAPDAR